LDLKSVAIPLVYANKLENIRFKNYDIERYEDPLLFGTYIYSGKDRDGFSLSKNGKIGTPAQSNLPKFYS
jgi:hypothetical protein